MAKLHPDDLKRIASRLPKDVRKELIYRKGLMVGGGFIRDSILMEKPRDIDIFGPSKDIVGRSAKELNDMRSVRRIDTNNAITLVGTNGRLTIQYITRWLYEDPEKLISEFDYTVAQAVIFVTEVEGKKVWDSCCSPLFYTDLASRRLRYTAPARHEDAGGSVLRMTKFLKRGYSISPEDLAYVVSRLVLGVGQFRQVGIDEPATAKLLTSLLREVDPSTVMLDGLEVQPNVAELEKELSDGAG